MDDIITFKGQEFDGTHGGPFDRGIMDSYYGRGYSPHKYPNGTHNLPRIDKDNGLTADETHAYCMGFEYDEECGDFKEW